MELKTTTPIDGKDVIWNLVSETDPNHTKVVDQRGGFTAICGYYQISRATALWGPMGHKWGYHYTREIFQGVVIIDLVLYYPMDPNGEDLGEIPTTASNQMFTIDKNGNQRVDEDAPKKAITDAITKALSMLGFSADVFTGMYDDNKYIADLNEKYGVATKSKGSRSRQASNDDFI